MGTGREWCGDRDGVVERDDEVYILELNSLNTELDYLTDGMP